MLDAIELFLVEHGFWGTQYTRFLYLDTHNCQRMGAIVQVHYAGEGTKVFVSGTRTNWCSNRPNHVNLAEPDAFDQLLQLVRMAAGIN